MLSLKKLKKLALLDQKRFEFKLLIKKSILINYMLNHFYFDEQESLISQIKLYKGITLASQNQIKNYSDGFESIDRIHE